MLRRPRRAIERVVGEGRSRHAERAGTHHGDRRRGRRHIDKLHHQRKFSSLSAQSVEVETGAAGAQPGACARGGEQVASRASRPSRCVAPDAVGQSARRALRCGRRARSVAQPPARACAVRRSGVLRVVEPAAGQRQAAAADATVEPVAQLQQRGDSRIEQPLPLARQALPVGGSRRVALAQRGERGAYVVQAQTHGLSGANEGHAAQRAARVQAVPAAAASAAEQATAFVEAQRTGRHACARRQLADREGVA